MPKKTQLFHGAARSPGYRGDQLELRRAPPPPGACLPPVALPAAYPLPVPPATGYLRAPTPLGRACGLVPDWYPPELERLPP